MDTPLMTVRSGAAVWDATPGDPQTGRWIAAELDTQTALHNADTARRIAAETDAALAHLLATLED